MNDLNNILYSDSYDEEELPYIVRSDYSFQGSDKELEEFHEELTKLCKKHNIDLFY